MGSKIALLERMLARLTPQLDPTADYAWTGNFGASKTGAPSIGPAPRMPNCYAVMGYGGDGIAFSLMAAQMLRGMIAGDGDPERICFLSRGSFEARNDGLPGRDISSGSQLS